MVKALSKIHDFIIAFFSIQNKVELHVEMNKGHVSAKIWNSPLVPLP